MRPIEDIILMYESLVEGYTPQKRTVIRRRTKGTERSKGKQYYRRNRNKINRNKKVYYRRVKKNPQFKKQRKIRRKNPVRIRAIRDVLLSVIHGASLGPYFVEDYTEGRQIPAFLVYETPKTIRVKFYQSGGKRVELTFGKKNMKPITGPTLHRNAIKSRYKLIIRQSPSTIESRFINDFDRDSVIEVLGKRRGVIGVYNDGYICARGLSSNQGITILLSKSYMSVNDVTIYNPSLHKAISELYKLDMGIGDMDIRTDSPGDFSQTVQWYVKNFKRDMDLQKEFQNNEYILLHGTSSEVWNNISEKGLRPRSMTRVSPTYGDDRGARPGDPRFVYLATTESMNSVRFAARDAAKKHGGTPVVLMMYSNTLDMSRMFPDEDSGAETWQGSVRKTGTLAYNGVILPSKISPFEILKDGWTPWDGLNS